ncbi:hypothetical protein, partial [Beijerinckia sp. L45]|uniref:hypothetical protein n=1 Tax=Beijerinckia sp. L45 TaxID=1641855 RepID=UPI001AED1E94
MNALSLLPLLPALVASGKSGEALGDLAGLAPVVMPVADKSESLTQLIERLPALHKSGKFKQMGDEIHS